MKKLVVALFVSLALFGCSTAPTEAEQALVTTAWEWASDVDYYADMVIVGTAMAKTADDDLAQRSEEQAKEDIATIMNLVSDSSKAGLLDELPDKYSDVKISYASLCSAFSDIANNAVALAEYKGEELEVFRKACEKAGFTVKDTAHS